MGIITAMINAVETDTKGIHRLDVDLNCLNVDCYQCFAVIDAILSCVSKANNISKDQVLDNFLDSYRYINRTDELV